MTAQVLQLGRVPYTEAWELQRAIAVDVGAGVRPDTILFLEHAPVITLGRRAQPGELHLPPGVEVEIVETNRGGKSTYHGPGQLICYPILDLQRHGSDVKRYVRMLERALIETVGAFGIEATRFDGDNMAGVWLPATRPGVTAGGLAPETARNDPPNGGTPSLPLRKVASIGVHVSKWVTTHGYALNVDLDTAPFTQWITACGLDGAAFTTLAREVGRPVTVNEVRPHAAAALSDVFGWSLEELPPSAVGPAGQKSEPVAVPT